MSATPERKYPRFDFLHFPWVFTIQLSEPWDGDKPLRLEAKNISGGGLKFVSNRRVALFEEVNVVLFTKNDGKELIRLRGRVVRLEEIDTGFGEKNYGIALEFLPGEDARFAPLVAAQSPGSKR